MLVNLLNSSRVESFHSLICDYEVITASRAQLLVEQIDCRENISRISSLFKAKKFREVILNSDLLFRGSGLLTNTL